MDQLINFEAGKWANIARTLIDSGEGKKYGFNDRSFYEEPVPVEFGPELRSIRNKHAHADYRRISTGYLTEFYMKYHKFVMHLYHLARDNWKVQTFESLDWNGITNFVEEIEKQWGSKP